MMRAVIVKMQSISLVSLSLLLGLGSAVPAAIAQSTTVQPLDDFRPDRPSGDLTGRGAGQISGVHDLIHRAMQGGRSLDEFRDEQQENLDSAADQFRAQQLQRLRNQPQANPSLTNPVPSTPTSPLPN